MTSYWCIVIIGVIMEQFTGEQGRQLHCSDFRWSWSPNTTWSITLPIQLAWSLPSLLLVRDNNNGKLPQRNTDSDEMTW